MNPLAIITKKEKISAISDAINEQEDALKTFRSSPYMCHSVALSINNDLNTYDEIFQIWPEFKSFVLTQLKDLNPIELIAGDAWALPGNSIEDDSEVILTNYKIKKLTEFLKTI